jgi:hypothetical protein
VIFLAPLFFYIGLGVAAGAVALHFIVTRQPTSSPLPTVRFIPQSAVRVTTLSKIPEDLLLLLARVLLAILLGAAFARPVLTPERRPVARIVMADVSRGVADIGEVRDSVGRLLGEGDALVVFDSAARVVRRDAADSAARLERSDRDGRLSPALIAALRTASEMRAGADSVELVIVSPFRARESDGATRAIRDLWPGRIRLSRVAATPDSLAPPAGFAVRAGAGDAISLAASVAGTPASDSAVRLVRGVASADDIAWVEGGRRTLVRWPVEGAPPGWVSREVVDTVGAVIANDAALVYPLERRWRPDSAAGAGRVAARWVDGATAAVERDAGAGCIRDVAIPVPARGDLVLRPAFAQLLAALAAPCQRAAGSRALGVPELQALAGSGPLAASSAIAPPEAVDTPLVPWLLGAALLLVLLELLVRRGAAPLWKDEAIGSESAARERAA